MHDIVTPTAGERYREDLERRKRRYFVVMAASLILFLVAALVPAPLAIRLSMMAVAAVLAPVAGMVANRNPF